jgi:DNA-binding transcriptional LysR family regulator
MDIKQLKYFRAIAMEGTVSGAAKRLFMTQPSLSQQLGSLEAELGVKLVERGSRRISLTEAGRLLNDRAGQLLDLLSATATEVKDLHEGFMGTLSIGAIASSGATLLPGLLRDYHRRYPDIRFQLYEGDTPRILELLNNGLIEVGIIRSAFSSELYHSLDLAPESFIAAMSAEWDCGDTGEMSLGELADKPLLLHRSNEVLVTECCQKAGFQPKILCLGDDVRTLLVLAGEGMGLAVIPKSALGLVPGSGILYREIVDAPLEIKKAVLWMRNRYLSIAARHFIDTIIPGAAGE